LEINIWPLNWDSSVCFLILLLLKTSSAVELKQQLCFAQDCGNTSSSAIRETKYFNLQTDERTDTTVTQQAPISFVVVFFDNSQTQVRCVFLALESVEGATAELLFKAIDKYFQNSTTLIFDNLVGLGRDGANVMLEVHNSVMSQSQCKQPALVALHHNCHSSTNSK